jgi:hypothetical protein
VRNLFEKARKSPAGRLYAKIWREAHDLMTQAHPIRRILFILGVITIVIPIAALIWLPGTTPTALVTLLFLVNLGRKKADS